MSQEIDRQEQAIRYLLGTLSEEEKTRLEERYFLDDTEFEELEIAEDELIDRYVQTELSAEDMTRFEKLLISPRLSERVEVARMLAERTASRSQIREVTREPETSGEPVKRAGWLERLFGSGAVTAPAFTPALALSLIFTLLSGVTLIFFAMRLRAESQRWAYEQQQREELRKEIAEQKTKYGELEVALNQTRQEKEEQEQLVAKLLAEQQRSTPAFSIPFYLDPGAGSRGSSGDAVQTVRIPRGAPLVGISLNVTDGDYSRYDAFMRNTDSAKDIVKRVRLRPFQHQGRKYITLKLDAKLLPPGNYNVRVNGITTTGLSENFDDYSFRVVSR